MSGFLGAAHPWVLALHIVSVIYWMAGMLMLPRFFAYHTEAAAGSDEARAWIERERRLLRIIVNPSMIASWTFGLLLAANLGFAGGWLHAKLAAVLALSALHGLFARWRKDLARGQNRHDSKFYRQVNEIPSIAIIVIVVLAIARPF